MFGRKKKQESKVDKTCCSTKDCSSKTTKGCSGKESTQVKNCSRTKACK